MTIQPLPVPIETKDEIRVLTADELERYVYPQYDASGNPRPDKSTSTFVGVLRGGRVVAFLGLQVKLHAQPLFIEDGYQSILPSLVDAAERIILAKCGPQWVYLFTPAGKLTQLAAHFGMQLEPWCVMSKLVAPAVPPKNAAADLVPFEDTPIDGIIQ